MDTLARLRELMAERNWSVYRLAKNSGISQNTLSNSFKRKSAPTIPTLEAVCRSFGITLSQFFAEYDVIELSPPLKEFIESWTPLTVEQKAAILQVMKSMSQK